MINRVIKSKLQNSMSLLGWFTKQKSIKVLEEYLIGKELSVYNFSLCAEGKNKRILNFFPFEFCMTTFDFCNIQKMRLTFCWKNSPLLINGMVIITCHISFGAIK